MSIVVPRDIFLVCVGKGMDSVDSAAAVLEEGVPFGVAEDFVRDFVSRSSDILLVEHAGQVLKTSIHVFADSVT
jgi:hypothetical protein